MSAADPFGLVGEVLDGQFRVDKLVGEGGFSAVYRGHHLGLNEPIAIKSLKLPPALDASLVDTFVKRFRDESRILYRLSQGNLHVVRSIAAGTTKSPATGGLVPYMVLEWLEGRSVQNDFTVRRTLGQTGRTVDETLKVFETAADGLAYAHAQGVVHRDLNPGNLFLANTHHGVKMKVLDFGVAKLMHDGALDLGPRQQTIGHIKIFAPAYGAPEQFDDRIGSVGAFSDVYAFALILIEALRDRCVNEGTHIGEFAQSACDPRKRPTPRSLGIEVSDEVEAAFVRATTLDPKERWQSAGDFWQSLTIANKVAIERRYESAARETPPLAMGGPPMPPNDAAVGGKNLARTIPLGVTLGLPRPGPAAPRPHIPTTIGIPLPSAGGRAAVPPNASTALSPAAVMGGPGRTLLSPPTPGTPLTPPASPPRASARPPSSVRNPGLPAVQPLATFGAPSPVPRTGTGTERPAAPATASYPSSPDLNAFATTDNAAPSSRKPAMLQSGAATMVADRSAEDEDEDEATRVHAPAPEMLRTLALHDAATVRARAQAMLAREKAARDGAAMPTPTAEEANVAEAAPEPPPSGGTLMMAPVAHGPRPSHESPPQPPHHRGPGGLGSTLAMASPLGAGFAPAPTPRHAREPQDWQAPTQAMPTVPLQAAPGMQGIPGAHGTPPQGMPAVNPAALAQPHGEGSAIGAPMMHGGSAPFAPPQPPAPAKPLPVVPIAIGLAALAIGGIGLGVFALRARHASPTDPARSTTSSEIAPDTSLTPVPVPVPDEPSAAPVVVPPVVEETDAAPAVVTEVPDAAPTVTAPEPPPPVVTPPPAVPPAGAPPTTRGVPAAAPVPAPPPATPPSAKPALDPNAFSEPAARARLAQANGVLAFCTKEHGMTGPGSASITFGPDGSVTSVNLEPPYAGTPEGNCVSSQFRRAKVSPFSGTPQTVRFSFEVPK